MAGIASVLVVTLGSARQGSAFAGDHGAAIDDREAVAPVEAIVRNPVRERTGIRHQDGDLVGLAFAGAQRDRRLAHEGQFRRLGRAAERRVDRGDLRRALEAFDLHRVADVHRPGEVAIAFIGDGDLEGAFLARTAFGLARLLDGQPGPFRTRQECRGASLVVGEIGLAGNRLELTAVLDFAGRIVARQDTNAERDRGSGNQDHRGMVAAEAAGAFRRARPGRARNEVDGGRCRGREFVDDRQRPVMGRGADIVHGDDEPADAVRRALHRRGDLADEQIGSRLVLRRAFRPLAGNADRDRRAGLVVGRVAERLLAAGGVVVFRAVADTRPLPSGTRTEAELELDRLARIEGRRRMLAHHRRRAGHAGPRRVGTRDDVGVSGRRHLLEHDLAAIRGVARIGDRDGEVAAALERAMGHVGALLDLDVGLALVIRTVEVLGDDEVHGLRAADADALGRTRISFHADHDQMHDVSGRSAGDRPGQRSAAGGDDLRGRPDGYAGIGGLELDDVARHLRTDVHMVDEGAAARRAVDLAGLDLETGFLRAVARRWWWRRPVAAREIDGDLRRLAGGDVAIVGQGRVVRGDRRHRSAGAADIQRGLVGDDRGRGEGGLIDPRRDRHRHRALAGSAEAVEIGRRELEAPEGDGIVGRRGGRDHVSGQGTAAAAGDVAGDRDRLDGQAGRKLVPERELQSGDLVRETGTVEHGLVEAEAEADAVADEVAAHLRADLVEEGLDPRFDDGRPFGRLFGHDFQFRNVGRNRPFGLGVCVCRAESGKRHPGRDQPARHARGKATGVHCTLHDCIRLGREAEGG